MLRATTDSASVRSRRPWTRRSRSGPWSLSTRYPRANTRHALNVKKSVPKTIEFRAWAQGQDFILTDVPFATLEEMDAAYMFLAQSGVIMNDSYLPEQKIASAKSRK